MEWMNNKAPLYYNLTERVNLGIRVGPPCQWGVPRYAAMTLLEMLREWTSQPPWRCSPPRDGQIWGDNALLFGFVCEQTTERHTSSAGTQSEDIKTKVWCVELRPCQMHLQEGVRPSKEVIWCSLAGLSCNTHAGFHLSSHADGRCREQSGTRWLCKICFECAVTSCNLS